MGIETHGHHTYIHFICIQYELLKPENLSFTLLKQNGAGWTKALPADCCLSGSKLYFLGLRKSSRLIKQQKGTLNFHLKCPKVLH